MLLDRGGRQYGFIHVTFQEYLAAVALAQSGQQDIQPVVVQLAEHIGEATWLEVSLLTIGYLGIVQKRDQAASAVVEALLADEPGPPGEAVIWAGRAVIDAGTAGVTPACRQAVVAALSRGEETSNSGVKKLVMKLLRWSLVGKPPYTPSSASKYSANT